MRILNPISGSALTALLLISGLYACGTGARTSSGDSAENLVNVYNWSDYIAPDTIAKFEAEFGIEVNYDVYDSSAIVDVKLLTGNSGYDVVIHSNHFRCFQGSKEVQQVC